jgi:phage terminase small subunit
MRGRKPKPLGLLKFEGKTHLTKQQIKEREAAEIKIGDDVFKAPDYVRADAVALAKWNELLVLYRDAPTKELVTSSDIDAIAQYCVTFSEQKYMIEQRAKAKTAKTKNKYNTPLLKNREMLIKLQNLLYLNPIAKIRNMGKKKPAEEADPLKNAGFGDI